MNTRKSLSLSSLTMSPDDIPATGLLIGTPAAISDNVDAHTEPCEVEPFDIAISETVLIAYGNSSSDGSTGMSDLSARAPWPISLLPGLLEGFASPVE